MEKQFLVAQHGMDSSAHHLHPPALSLSGYLGPASLSVP